MARCLGLYFVRKVACLCSLEKVLMVLADSTFQTNFYFYHVHLSYISFLALAIMARINNPSKTRCSKLPQSCSLLDLQSKRVLSLTEQMEFERKSDTGVTKRKHHAWFSSQKWNPTFAHGPLLWAKAEKNKQKNDKIIEFWEFSGLDPVILVNIICW